MSLKVYATASNMITVCLSCTQFMDFCKNYRELQSMGFPKAIIAGALIAHTDDFAAATEACLAAQ